MCATAPRNSRPGSRKPSGEEYSPQRTAPLSLRTPSTDTLNRPVDCALATVAAPTASTTAKGHSKALGRIDVLPRVILVTTPGVLSFGLVEGEGEAEQRQAHLDRLFVGVLHRDLQVGAGAHGGDELVGERHGDEASHIRAGLDRLLLGRTV